MKPPRFIPAPECLGQIWDIGTTQLHFGKPYTIKLEQAIHANFTERVLM